MKNVPIPLCRITMKHWFKTLAFTCALILEYLVLTSTAVDVRATQLARKETIAAPNKNTNNDENRDQLPLFPEGDPAVVECYANMLLADTSGDKILQPNEYVDLINREAVGRTDTVVDRFQDLDFRLVTSYFHAKMSGIDTTEGDKVKLEHAEMSGIDITEGDKVKLEQTLTFVCGSVIQRLNELSGPTMSPTVSSSLTQTGIPSLSPMTMAPPTSSPMTSSPTESPPTRGAASLERPSPIPSTTIPTFEEQPKALRQGVVDDDSDSDSGGMGILTGLAAGLAAGLVAGLVAGLAFPSVMIVLFARRQDKDVAEKVLSNHSRHAHDLDLAHNQTGERISDSNEQLDLNASGGRPKRT